MIVTEEITDPWHRVLATAGTKVTIIADHSGILIAEDKQGNRFPVKSEVLRDDPEEDKESQKAP